MAKLEREGRGGQAATVFKGVRRGEVRRGVASRRPGTDFAKWRIWIEGWVAMFGILIRYRCGQAVALRSRGGGGRFASRI
jgi:hypothetical protein